MRHPYEDILTVSYPFPTLRRRMSMTDRAAQFSPFAALTGYDSIIQETGRITDNLIELDIDGRTILDEKLRFLFKIQDQRPEVTVTYFFPDSRKSGGSYIRVSDNLKKVDINRKVLILMNGTFLSFAQIYDISTDTFPDWWPEDTDDLFLNSSV